MDIKDEALKLSPILKDLVEGTYSNLENLYELDQADGDGFVDRASELLVLLSTQLAQAQAEKAELVKAARDLVDRWHTPKWKDAPHTGEFIAKLEALLPKTRVEG